MSFLSILLFASAFYFAHGRPDTTAAAAAANQTDVVSSSESLPDDSISSEENGQYQDELNGFIEAMSLAIDNFMLPIMTDLTEDKQDQVKTMAINGFGGFFNYIILMYKNEDNSTGLTTEGPNFPLDGNDIILEFDSLEPLDEDSLLIPTITTPKAETKPEEGVDSKINPTVDSETKPESKSNNGKSK